MSYPHGGEEAFAYYVNESSYGVTPANPAFQWIGILQNVEPAIDPSLIKLRGLGSRQLQYILAGLRKVNLKIDYAMQNKAFLNNIASGWPTGSGTPMSIEVYYISPATGNLDFNLLHKGCLLNKVAVKGSVLSGEDMEINVETEIIGQDVSVGTSHPTGATYAADPGTTPKRGSDVKIELATVEVTDIYEFTFSIVNNLKRYPVIRSTSGNLLKWLLGRQLELDIELTAYLTNKQYVEGLMADWSGEIKFTIGTDTYTFSGCKYASINLPTKVEAEVPQKLKFTAKSLAIA